MDSNSHSVFKLNYHLVLSTYQRRPFITLHVSKLARHMFARIGINHRVTLIQWQWYKNHVIIRFDAHPNSHITRFINAYKSASSRKLKEQLEVPQPAFWNKSFLLVSTGEALTPEEIDYYLEARR